MRFRSATPADHDIVLAFIREYYAYDHIPFDADTMSPALQTLLADPTLGRVYLARVDGADAGYLIATFSYDIEFGGRIATVTDLFFRESFRGLGLGREAFHLLDQLSAEWKINALLLQVEDDNTEARAFYQKIGFILSDRLSLAKRTPSASR